MNEKVKLIKPGFKYKWQRPGVSNTIIHILLIAEDHVLFKWYSYIKKSWRYQIENEYLMVSFLNDGHIVEKAKSRQVRKDFIFLPA